MLNNFNKQDDIKKNGNAFINSNGALKKHTVLTAEKKTDKKIDAVKLKLIYEELPDHCVQFFFLS